MTEAPGSIVETQAVRAVPGESGKDAESVACSARERPRTPPDEVGGGSAREEVVVLDYGGQYSQLIARRIRDCGVFSELLPHHVPLEEVAKRKPRGIILSGGPASVYAPGAPSLERGLLELGVPVLGICYGMQLLVHDLGGRVEQAEVGEFGRSELTVTTPGVLLAGMPKEQPCWMSHRDPVFEPPQGFTALASSTGSPVAAVQDAARRIDGIQFHPEVVHTPDRQEILTGLSGGVASSVAALLVHRAVGDQLTCVFVDHGLMRKDEGEQVISAFRDTFGVPLVAVDAEQRFLEKLKGVTEPEAKRKAIGAEFIRVFEEEAAKISQAGDGDDPARPGVRYLVQGTLYSDVIESGGGTGAATIKDHHHVGRFQE